MAPPPRGRSQRAYATALHVAHLRQLRRIRRQLAALLVPSRELFQRAHVVLQIGNPQLAAALFEQCVAALPGGKRGRHGAVRVLRAMAFTQLGQLAEVRCRPAAPCSSGRCQRALL